MASGVPAGAIGLSPVVVGALAGPISLVCVGGGAWLGRSTLTRVAGQYAAAAGGGVLIAIASLALSS